MRDSKGQFVKGHISYKGMLGKKHSPETREKMSLVRLGKIPWNKGLKGVMKAWNKGIKGKDSHSFGHKMTQENKKKLFKANYKGENAGYMAKHKWVSRWKGKPNLCEDCGSTISKRFEWANISGKYFRDLNDYKRLCSKCHHKFDDIANRGWKTRKLCS